MELNLPRSSRFAVFRNRPLITLMLEHLTVYAYIGLLPMLYPLLIDRFGLDFKTAGWSRWPTPARHRWPNNSC